MVKLLDLYCGAGGAAVGYHRAGFDVVGVDIKPQPNYPFEFVQADVLSLERGFLNEFDAIHASPPCQAYSKASNIHRAKGRCYVKIIDETRELLSENPYIIENVLPKLLKEPLKLCGTMFKLRTLRHRYFEFESLPWIYPPCECKHIGTVGNGDYVEVVGHGGGRHGISRYADRCAAMGIDWMTNYELTQAIPPAYTEWIGKLIIGNQ